MSFNEYFAELKKVQLLEPQQEAELWLGYKEHGDLACRRTLIERYQPLVFKTAMRWSLPEPVLMDIIQEGTVGLIEAVENYDHQRNVAFSLYALHRIRGRMMNYLQKEGKSNLAFAGSASEEDWLKFNRAILEVEDTAPSISDQAEQNFLIQQVLKAMNRLPDKEQLVISGVFLNEQEPKHLAQTLDMSISHVYRLQKQGIRRIRGMLSKLMHELKR